jgi:hypothetical protein
VRARLVLLAICFFVGALAPRAGAQTAQEEVKATFLYRFTSFVTWPTSSFADAAAPMQVCTTGSQRVGGRNFLLRRISDADNVAGCNVLYVVGDRTEAALRAARRRGILTITDGGGERGIIHFVVVDARVRFYIDDALAAESGLSVDPRLLSLALSVRRRPLS